MLYPIELRVPSFLSDAVDAFCVATANHLRHQTSFKFYQIFGCFTIVPLTKPLESLTGQREIADALCCRRQYASSLSPASVPKLAAYLSIADFTSFLNRRHSAPVRASSLPLAK